MSKKRTLLRTYDIILCLIIFCILVVPVSLLIVFKLAMDGFPLFYNSTRIGKNRKAFTVYKFRSMVNDRNVIDTYLSSIRSYGFEKIPLSAIVYTKIGRIFEKFQIVEVLQIFNVLEGNMSLIGYRPLPISRVMQLEEELGVKAIETRHSVKPGITGISQIVGKATLSNRDRVILENNYNLMVHNQPQLKVIYYNTLIIFETVGQIFFKRNFFIKSIIAKINSTHIAMATDDNRDYVPTYTPQRIARNFRSKSRSRIAS